MSSDKIVTLPLEEYLELKEIRDSFLEENKDKILIYYSDYGLTTNWKLIASEEFKTNFEKDLLPKMQKAEKFLDERDDLRENLQHYKIKCSNYYYLTIILGFVSLCLIIKHVFNL